MYFPSAVEFPSVYRRRQSSFRKQDQTALRKEIRFVLLESRERYHCCNNSPGKKKPLWQSKAKLRQNFPPRLTILNSLKKFVVPKQIIWFIKEEKLFSLPLSFIREANFSQPFYLFRYSFFSKCRTAPGGCLRKLLSWSVGKGWIPTLINETGNYFDDSTNSHRWKISKSIKTRELANKSGINGWENPLSTYIYKRLSASESFPRPRGIRCIEGFPARYMKRPSIMCYNFARQYVNNAPFYLLEKP